MPTRNSSIHNQDRNTPIERQGRFPFSSEIHQQHLSGTRLVIKIIEIRITKIFLKESGS